MAGKGGSEDSHARALWAVGTALGRSQKWGHRNLCALFSKRGLPLVERFSSPRAWAFALLAIHEYLRAFPATGWSVRCGRAHERLLDLFRANSSTDWQWFERSPPTTTPSSPTR